MTAGAGAAAGGDGSDRLGELIRRERSILNWTIKLSRRVDGDNPRDVYSFDRLMRSQAEVADLTRLLAERLAQQGVDDVDALYQAEAVMLEAIDSLSVSDLETAQLQEKDAQQYLVEGRDVLEVNLSNRGSDRIDYQALRNINDMIMQRLRRDPNSDRERRNAVQFLVTQLIRMARAEEEIADELAAVGAATANETTGTGQIEQPPEEQEQTPSESMSDGESDDETDPVDFAAIEERQFELLADARELAGAMADAQGLTSLANERMTDATDTMEETAQAIEGRDTPVAQDGARQSARQLRELARQIIGLTRGDVMERLAFGRNLTTDLSRRQRQMADEMDAAADPPAEDMPAEALPIGMLANDVVDRALTLEDVLQAIANSSAEEDAEAADRVTEAIEERNLSGVRQRLEEMAAQLDPQDTGGDTESDQQRPGSAAMAAEMRDAADSMERLASDLNQIHRQLFDSGDRAASRSGAAGR